MTAMEMLVIIGGLFFGYVVVTVLMNPKNKNATDNARAEQFQTRENSQEEQRSWQKNAAEPPPSAPDDIANTWFRVLDVPENAAMPTISAAYKRKIREYHPDKVASLGAELKILADAKSKQINAAYDFAKRLPR